MAEEIKFTDLQKQMRGAFWGDHLSIDKRIIESRFCPKCNFQLVYRGYSNRTEYRAYGVCEECDYARRFWTETVELVAAKKGISKAGA